MCTCLHGTLPLPIHSGSLEFSSRLTRSKERGIRNEWIFSASRRFYTLVRVFTRAFFLEPRNAHVGGQTIFPSFISGLMYLTAARKHRSHNWTSAVNGRKARGEQFRVTSTGWQMSSSTMKAERKRVVRLRNASPTTSTGSWVKDGARVYGGREGWQITGNTAGISSRLRLAL